MKTTNFSPHDIQRELQPLFEKYSFVRALYQNTSGLTITANLTQTIAEPTLHARGVVITVIQNGVLFEASTSLSSMSNLKDLIHGMKNRLNDYPQSQNKFELKQEDQVEKSFQSKQGDDIPLEEKILIAQHSVKQIKNMDSLVVMSQVRYKHTLTEEFYISKKKVLSQKISRFEAIFIAVLKDANNNSAQIYDGYGYQGSWEKAKPPISLIKKMIVDGKKILGAPRLKPGFYECIFSPGMAGILAHEAFGHGTEADTMLKGRAKGSDYINKKVASDLVSLYDSPSLANIMLEVIFLIMKESWLLQPKL